MKTINKSVLLRTSAATDVLNSNGNLSITGLRTVPKKYITNLTQVKYRAEVAQVVTVGAAQNAITASTTYTVLIGDSNRVDSGYQESLKRYSYTTSPTLAIEGATAALRREYVNLQLVSDINDDASNHVVAASLLLGTGFTITDDGSYYPVFAQGMTNLKGVTQVIVVTNDDGTGFVSTDWSVTTTGVYSFGSGAILASMAPVIDAMFGGNLISGVIDAPPLTTAGLSAVSGQNYDGFFIDSVKEIATYGGMNGQYAFVPQLNTAYVDNGTGSSTTNLAGFKAFEREFHKNVAQALFSQDVNSVIEFFDKPMIFQANVGTTPYTGALAGTADLVSYVTSPYGGLEWECVGSQTIFGPTIAATGLNLEQDQTATEGNQYSAITTTVGTQQFVVGKQEFSVTARVVMADWTDSSFQIGFRKKAAYTAVVNAYSDYATIGNGSSAAGTTYINGDLFATRAEINGAGILETVSAVAPVDAVSVLLQVKVSINGTVRAYVDGVSYPIYSAGTTQMVFDDGDIMIPFFAQINIGGGDADPVISELVAVAKKDWIVTAV